jgi:hypothetical protein
MEHIASAGGVHHIHSECWSMEAARFEGRVTPVTSFILANHARSQSQ